MHQVPCKCYTRSEVAEFSSGSIFSQLPPYTTSSPSPGAQASSCRGVWGDQPETKCIIPRSSLKDQYPSLVAP